MKKVAALVLSLIMVLGLAGCARQNPNAITPTELVLPNEETVSEGEEPKELVVKKSSEYADSFDGLKQYLSDNYIVAGDPITMSFEAIGAVDGCKFAMKYDGRSGSVEVYEFDLENLSEIAKDCLDSIKENGYYTMLDTEVPAEISENGKYIMIYTFEDSTDKLKEQKERAIELFKDFHA